MTYTKGKNKNGVILHESAERVVIATGFKRKSANTKTGEMIQIWILVRKVNPNDAIKLGLDRKICGDCVHRGIAEIIDDVEVRTGRRCYVNVGQAPNAIFKAYQRGAYRKAKLAEYPALFGGRTVRLGAYGDPAFIPHRIVEAIVTACRDWTGYTHQWRDERYQNLSQYVMASADSERDTIDATKAGWRTFRVRHHSQAVLQSEIVCPASDEGGHRTTCSSCRLCNGKKHGAHDGRKNIVIIDHSVIARSQPLIQIGA